MGGARIAGLVVLTAVMLTAFVALVVAATGDVVLVSSSNGTGGNGASFAPATTADGAATAFLSRATNLTADTVPGTVPEAFVRVQAAAQPVLASRADGATGAAANAAVDDVSVSDDGRYVAFHSRATNLVAGATTATDRAYVRDLQTAATVLAAPSADDDAVRPLITPNGNAVLFASHAVYDGGSGASLKLYERDLTSTTVTLVSREDGAAGRWLVGDQPAASADGHIVAFRGQSAFIDSPISGVQVIVRDLDAHTTTVASAADGSDTQAATAAGEPDISRNGRYVVFDTTAANLGDATNAFTQVYERDMQTKDTLLVSRRDGPGGAVGDQNSGSPTVSDSGHRVAFISTADNLSDIDNNNGDNAFVRDTANGTTTQVHGLPGQTQPQAVIQGVSLSGTGRLLAYDTNATLLPGETGTVSDVFQRDLGDEPPAPAPPVLSVAGPGGGQLREGAAGSNHDLPFVVSLSKPYTHRVSVMWATSDGTATAGSDYVATEGTLSFAPGQTAQVAYVTVTGDDVPEPDETFHLTLSTPRNATIASATADGAILDDDTPPALSVGDATVVEGDAGTDTVLAFPVTRTGSPFDPVSVHYATADATASAGSDYVAASGTLTLVDGQTGGSILVTVHGDALAESDETLTVTLSDASAGSIARSQAVGTITNDDGTPSPTPSPTPTPTAPPPSANEHTLLGQVTADPAFGVGVAGLEALGPFAGKPAPKSLVVALLAPGGATIVQQALTPQQDRSAPALFRFDNLAACAGCALELRDGSAVEDLRTVSFPGDAGQTDADLVYDRAGQGGAVNGTVLAPGRVRPTRLAVIIRDAAGNTLADTSKVTGCSARVACPVADSYAYRLTGLPRAAVPVTAVLMQSPDRGRPFPVDSAAFTLDPSGETRAPDLTALSAFPGTVKGRTLFGRINTLAPFAPGARKPSDLDGPSALKRKLHVELRNGKGRAIAEDDRLAVTGGYLGYELQGLAACSDCDVVLLEDRRVVDTQPVILGAADPSLTRRDLSFAAAGTRELVAGVVVAGAASPRSLRVVVSDAATGELLASTDEGKPACAKGSRCVTTGELPYLLGGAPAGRDALITLEVDGHAVDSEPLQLSGAGQITQAPDLVIPAVAGPRVLQGTVTPAGPYDLGRSPAPWKGKLAVRLLDGARIVSAAEVATRGGGRGTYALGHLDPCEDCTLELLDGATVSDRTTVTIPAVAPRVTLADLGWQELSGGAYVQGAVVPRGGTINGLVVQVLSSAGKVLAQTTGERRPITGRTGYRLGQIPRDAGKVKVVVLAGKKRVASAAVTLAPGTADTIAPDLKVDADAARKG